MTGQGLILVGLTALITVISNLLLRGGVTQAGGFGLSSGHLLADLLRMARQPLVVTGVILYGTATLIWFRVISTENLNSSYPLLVSLSFILVTVGATLFFNEPVTWQKVVGLVVILAGIVLVSHA